MSKIFDGGPVAHNRSMRDYFAAKAMQGMITTRHPQHSGEDGAEVLSQDAYAIADAMLAEREKGGAEPVTTEPERSPCKPDCPIVHREYATSESQKNGGPYTCRKCGFHLPF